MEHWRRIDRQQFRRHRHVSAAAIGFRSRRSTRATWQALRHHAVARDDRRTVVHTHVGAHLTARLRGQARALIESPDNRPEHLAVATPRAAPAKRSLEDSHGPLRRWLVPPSARRGGPIWTSAVGHPAYSPRRVGRVGRRHDAHRVVFPAEVPMRLHVHQVESLIAARAQLKDERRLTARLDLDGGERPATLDSQSAPARRIEEGVCRASDRLGGAGAALDVGDHEQRARSGGRDVQVGVPPDRRSRARVVQQHLDCALRSRGKEFALLAATEAPCARGEVRGVEAEPSHEAVVLVEKVELLAKKGGLGGESVPCELELRMARQQEGERGGAAFLAAEQKELGERVCAVDAGRRRARRPAHALTCRLGTMPGRLTAPHTAVGPQPRLVGPPRSHVLADSVELVPERLT
mmetsp:Transcript_19357/g.58427  ORF Transcript_19357/g.58427 Transcript_19357/m.58427 type:complete len:408 (+) Transcript_19357:475-1698(+)